MTTAGEFFAQRNSEIAAAYSAGEPIDQISARTGVSVATVRTIARAFGARLPYGHVPRVGRPKGPHNPDRDKLICEQYNSGRSLEDVGQEHGVTRERIRQILVREGVSERHNAFNMPRRVGARALAEIKTSKSAERLARFALDRATVREMYDAGATYEDIAGTLHHPITWVQNHVWRTGGPSRYASAGKPKRRITPEEKTEIGRRYGMGDNIALIARDFNICIAYVAQVANRVGIYRKPHSPAVLRIAGDSPDGEASSPFNSVRGQHLISAALRPPGPKPQESLVSPSDASPIADEGHSLSISRGR